ncbi:glucosidase [Lentzea sp. BCCO 10_0856]|uniref:Glucosidase n=1 Tax=Lentzea miocenica TaxID=3095431 RepID=A0ABU4ST96_9PSEU|nr:glucosidase [Lentzea sp. BCCO 10_0856]MDX8029118.1 glucosidase [Lentzea sp. BCCO 10_0856]
MVSAEKQRLQEAGPWRRWGPYLSERQWGTVREGGDDAWTAFTHDQARYRAYRWGEDGLAGFSDDRQRVCLSLALWNGTDTILKERLFGLTNGEGNHGEDVKECYYYLDATPTSSYLRMLYKYPQAKFPYEDLVATNAARTRQDPEYELLDTGVFDDDRYFDVVVEYAKDGPEDVLMRVTAHNRGPEEATLHLLPTLWFRHTWSWAGDVRMPTLHTCEPGTVRAEHPELGVRWWYVAPPAPILVTENETDNERVFGSSNVTPHVKDGIERAVLHGDLTAVTPDGVGTKAAAHHEFRIPAGQSATVSVRLSDHSLQDPFADFDATITKRREEADDFYDEVLGGDPRTDERLVCRQALAGLLWSRQYYAFDVERWLTERGADPLGGDQNWRHLVAEDVIVMPDKWEYPWFAAWDLAFHAVPLVVVDPELAKQQIDLLLGRRYLHPNGQIPAYEWNFSDVNPPAHAWAAWFVYQYDGDKEFLARVFPPLLRAFGWWLNRKDADGRNLFQGGFLGLDNIGVFDRSAPLPTGGRIDQADGTAWMALYCQNLIQMALELGEVEQAATLLENLAWIAAATGNVGSGLWDEEDGFFHDVLRHPDGTTTALKVRSAVGLLPLAAATVIGPEVRREHPELVDGMREFLDRHPAVRAALWGHGAQTDADGPVLFSLFDESRLRRILARMLDPAEFLSPHGIRSLSRWHAEHPYVLTVDGVEHRVGYLPAESDSGMFGGNSNWRGPVWFPINALVIRALRHLHEYYGDEFTVECPTGSGRQRTLRQVADDIGERLLDTFLSGVDGRPVHGGQTRYRDPHWQELPLFYEYLHGDNGAGVGASHQTGWTALVALLPREVAR